MSVASFNGTTFCTDQSAGTYYGGARFVEGDIEDVMLRRRYPRSNGCQEITSGDECAHHVLQCEWGTSDEATVRALLRNWRILKTIGILRLEKQIGASDQQFSYCRLAKIGNGPTIGGTLGNGTAANFTATLIFIQTRFVD